MTPDELRRCGAKKKTTGTCQRVLDAFGVCPTHGQRPVQPAAGAPDSPGNTGSRARQRTASLQSVAAAALAEGMTQKEAAALAGVHEDTLGVWLRERPELRAEADELRQVLQGRYVDAVWADLDAVRSMVVADALNPKTKPSDRHRILKTLVDTANGTESATDVKRKLDEIHRFIRADDEQPGDEW